MARSSFIWLKNLQERVLNVHIVEQTKKMIPFITREVAFRQHVGELVFGINVILSNGQSSATL